MTGARKGKITPDERSETARATVILNLQGEVCPFPAMYTGERLERMAPGEVLEVLADGMCAVEGIPAAVTQSGHKLLSVETIKGGVYRFLIERQ